MRDYHQYVPERPDGHPFVLPLWCDGLSCERGHDAHVSVFNARSSWSRLQGLAPSVQEWHKRQLHMEDIWKACYSTDSARDDGTLYNLCNVLGLTNVEADVTNCMNEAQDFCNTVLDGYVIGSAMEFMGTNVMDQPPPNYPDEEEEQLLFKANITDHIMDLAFHTPSLHYVVKEPEEKDCCCGRELPDGQMVLCSSEGQCDGRMWYHLSCLKLKKAPRGKWYCKDCQHKLPSIDHKLEYTKFLMWKLLNIRVRHTAIRYNDGDAMIAHWKFNLVEFYLRNHHKYFIYAHRLLSAILGAASPQLAHVLKWNRTINPNGGTGNNLEMDLKMEFYNRAYKESSKASRGQLTDATIARHSKMLAVAESMHKSFDSKKKRRKRRKVDNSAAVDKVALRVLDQSLSIYTPGRFHKRFPSIQLRTTKAQLHGLANRIEEHRRHLHWDKRLTYFAD